MHEKGYEASVGGMGGGYGWGVWVGGMGGGYGWGVWVGGMGGGYGWGVWVGGMGGDRGWEGAMQLQWLQPRHVEMISRTQMTQP